MATFGINLRVVCKEQKNIHFNEKTNSIDCMCRFRQLKFCKLISAVDENSCQLNIVHEWSETDRCA